MKFVFERPDLEQELIAARTLETLEAAMVKLSNVAAGFNDPTIYGRKLFTPALDALVPKMASKLRLPDVPLEPSNENVCILATRFYSTGGHTRVALDIVERLGPERRPVLILSETYHRDSYRVLWKASAHRAGLGERAVLFLSSGALVDRTVELYMMLAAIRPTRIILMAHPMDVVSVVGAWPFRNVVEFLHHADHVPGLGATLPFSKHVDLTYTCHLACRQAGLDAVYAGMTTAPFETPAREPEQPKRLRIATCANQHKYEKPGRHTWTDYAIAALRQPGAEILHIGATDEAFEQRIRGALTAAGLDPQRYVFGGLKPSLPEELIRQNIDVYLSSYPVPGGKANLEAMLAGVPVVVPIDPDAPPLLRYRVPLPRWIEIRGPDQLRNGLARARELGRTMRSPEQAGIAERERARFDDFAAGRRPQPAPAEDVLPD
jgi:hypothetical protein